AVGPVERAEAEADAVADQVVEDAAGGADLVELVEDQADDVADLLVGVHRDPIGGELDVAGGGAEEELAPPPLLAPACLETILHRNRLEFADGALGIHEIRHEKLHIPLRSPRRRSAPATAAGHVAN